MTTQRPKAIFFDCFGVLYSNALESFYARHQDFFRANAAQLAELNMQVNLGRITRDQAYEEFEKLGGVTATELRKEVNEKLILDTQLVAFIKQLKDRFKIGLLSNAGQSEIAIIYRDHLDTLFDSITVSYEVGSAKPGPKIYIEAASRLGLSPADCILVDDSASNLRGAEVVGMQIILYPTFRTIPHELSVL